MAVNDGPAVLVPAAWVGRRPVGFDKPGNCSATRADCEVLSQHKSFMITRQVDILSHSKETQFVSPSVCQRWSDWGKRGVGAIESLTVPISGGIFSK